MQFLFLRDKLSVNFAVFLIKHTGWKQLLCLGCRGTWWFHYKFSPLAVPVELWDLIINTVAKNIMMLETLKSRFIVNLYSFHGRCKASHLLVDWVDLNFECSTVCPILPGLVGIWQKRLARWARWWNTQININRTHVLKQMGHPVYMYISHLNSPYVHELQVGCLWETVNNTGEEGCYSYKRCCIDRYGWLKMLLLCRQ